MKYFKGDETEQKVVEAVDFSLGDISAALDDYFDSVYESVPLGEFLFDQKRVPLTNAFRRDIFIRCFKDIFEAWSFCGTAESYITVFKKIFGDDVDIVFTVPAPGKLTIDISASDVQESIMEARYIVDNAYVYYDIVDDVGDSIVFSSLLGIETQSELEKVLFTMVPGGIYTVVSLTIG